MQISDFFPEDSCRESLIKVQRIVSEKTRIKDDFEDIHHIGAVDQAFLGNRIISGSCSWILAHLRSKNAHFPSSH